MLTEHVFDRHFRQLVGALISAFAVMYNFGAEALGWQCSPNMRDRSQEDLGVTECWNFDCSTAKSDFQSPTDPQFTIRIKKVVYRVRKGMLNSASL